MPADTRAAVRKMDSNSFFLLIMSPYFLSKIQYALAVA
jgi:hypothetical protein